MAASAARRRRSSRLASLRNLRLYLYGLWYLARPTNLYLITFTSACALLFVRRDTGPLTTATLWSWGLMLLSTLLIALGGYWVNDLYDQPIDRVNRPERARWVALVGGRRLVTATLLVWGLGLGLSAMLPWRIALLHLGAVGLLAWYARWGKKTGLLGNAAIALLTGLVPWEVLLLTGRTSYPADWMIPLAVGFNFVRELVKDAEDLPGDQLYGVRSLATQLSGAVWQGLLGSLEVALVGLALAPGIVKGLLWKDWPIGYFGAVGLSVGLPVGYGLLSIRDYRRQSRSLKLAMAGGLLSLWFL